MIYEIDLLQENINDDSCENFQHVLKELEIVRQEAYEEKCRREKVERVLCEAFQKVSILICSYHSHCKQYILEYLSDLHCAQYMRDKFFLLYIVSTVRNIGDV